MSEAIRDNLQALDAEEAPAGVPEWEAEDDPYAGDEPADDAVQEDVTPDTPAVKNDGSYVTVPKETLDHMAAFMDLVAQAGKAQAESVGQPTGITPEGEKKTLYDVMDMDVDALKADIINNATSHAAAHITAVTKMVTDFNNRTAGVPEEIREEWRNAIMSATPDEVKQAVKTNQIDTIVDNAIGRAVKLGKYQPVRAAKVAPVNGENPQSASKMTAEETEFYNNFRAFGVTEKDAIARFRGTKVK